jgi:hypothetical protein
MKRLTQSLVSSYTGSNYFIFSRIAIAAKLQQNTPLPVPVYGMCVIANILIAGYNV